MFERALILAPIDAGAGDPILDHVKAEFCEAALSGTLRDAEDWAQCLVDLNDFRDFASVVAPLN